MQACSSVLSFEFGNNAIENRTQNFIYPHTKQTCRYSAAKRIVLKTVFSKPFPLYQHEFIAQFRYHTTGAF